MIIECSSCSARYQYDVARFEGKPSKKIRCAKCQQVFEIRNPDLEPAPVEVGASVERPSTEMPSPHRDESPGDMTIARGRRAEPSPERNAEEAPAAASRPDLQIPSDRRFSIAITDGADPGTVFRIETPRVTIGRAGADIALDDAEVSREHAAIEIRNSVVLLSDLGSTNGTVVDGHRIVEPYELQNQQEFVVGMTTLMLIVTWSE